MSEYFEELKSMIDPSKGYDMERIERAYLLAEKAHSGQFAYEFIHNLLIGVLFTE